MAAMKGDSGLWRIAAIPEEKRGVLIWRMAAIIICLGWAIDFWMRAFVLVTVIREQDILSFPVFIAFYAMAGVLFIVSMFFPRELYIHGGLCWLWGLLRIIDGGSITALSLHILGYLFFTRRGFFRAFPRVKLSVAVLVVLLALASQIRYSVTLLIERCLQLFDFSLLVLISMMIFYPELSKAWQRWKNGPKLLELDPKRFNAHDVTILRKVLAGDKYDSVAKDVDISLSTLKKRIRILFIKIGVQDKTDFLAKYARATIELEEPPAPPPSSAA
jgi:DNA-binding CsgD family transcriptional regulator